MYWEQESGFTLLFPIVTTLSPFHQLYIVDPFLNVSDKTGLPCDHDIIILYYINIYMHIIVLIHIVHFHLLINWVYTCQGFYYWSSKTKNSINSSSTYKLFTSWERQYILYLSSILYQFAIYTGKSTYLHSIHELVLFYTCMNIFMWSLLHIYKYQPLVIFKLFFILLQLKTDQNYERKKKKKSFYALYFSSVFTQKAEKFILCKKKKKYICCIL